MIIEYYLSDLIIMSGVQLRLSLKRTPIDTWSLREQLTLASAVLKSGDQNWVTGVHQ